MKLNEKLIIYNNRAKYGQVVILAGGAGSGKSFAAEKFLDADNYKISNVDDLKKKIMQYDKIKSIDIKKLFDRKFMVLKDKFRQEFIRLMKKYGNIDIFDFNLANPDHVLMLHLICDMLGWKEKLTAALINENKYLPNILFDITAAEIGSLKNLITTLQNAGYQKENIHLTWILQNYKMAVKLNKERPRVVPQDILLATHLGASQSMYEIIMDKSKIGIDGRIDVILNNPENTVFYIDKKTKQPLGVVKDFIYLPVKKAGGGYYPELTWKRKLYDEIMAETPIMKTLDDLLDEFES